MNTTEQVTAVKDIIKIKNKILRSSDWDDIADLIQSAIATSANVPANDQLGSLDRTKSKEWNIISIKGVMKQVKERGFENIETAYPVVAASLLRLAMVFVKDGINDVNRILAESLLNKGTSQLNTKAALRGRL